LSAACCCRTAARCRRAYRCCCCCCLQSPNPTDLGRREEAHNCLQSPNPTDFGRREEAHTCTLALNRLRALIDTNSNLAMCHKNWRCATNRRGATNRRLPSLQSPNPTDLGRREEAHNCLQSPNPTDFGRREEAHTCTLALNRLRALIDTNSNLAMCRKNWRCATNRRGATNRRLPSSIPMLYVSLTCRLILSLLPLLYLLNLSQMSNISVWRCAAKTGDVPQTGEVPPLYIRCRCAFAAYRRCR
jgi:hypothetical protein